MTDTVVLFLLVSVLAFLVGFVIRRGSICAVAAFLKPSPGKFDLIGPVPPSGARRESQAGTPPRHWNRA